MTENEAKSCIQGKLDCMNRCDVFDCKNTDECDNCNFCYSQGNFGEQKKAFGMAIQALEKQVPKKPIDKIMYLECPACGDVGILDCGYCPVCGQKLDWQ